MPGGPFCRGKTDSLKAEIFQNHSIFRFGTPGGVERNFSFEKRLISTQKKLAIGGPVWYYT